MEMDPRAAGFLEPTNVKPQTNLDGWIHALSVTPLYYFSVSLIQCSTECCHSHCWNDYCARPLRDRRPPREAPSPNGDTHTYTRRKRSGRRRARARGASRLHARAAHVHPGQRRSRAPCCAKSSSAAAPPRVNGGCARPRRTRANSAPPRMRASLRRKSPGGLSVAGKPAAPESQWAWRPRHGAGKAWHRAVQNASACERHVRSLRRKAAGRLSIAAEACGARLPLGSAVRAERQAVQNRVAVASLRRQGGQSPP